MTVLGFLAGERKMQKLGLAPDEVTDVTENDVYLFPTGMSAIWNAHHLALSSMTRPTAKSVCFGYAVYIFVVVTNLAAYRLSLQVSLYRYP